MGRYKDRIDARFEAQERKGIEKYGQVIEENHGSFDYRLEHLAGELTDGLMYIEWIKEAGQIVTSMFELLVQDMETRELCPLETPCTPDNLKDGGCIDCLKTYYEGKARDKLGL
jgi:hypothetical protein